MSLFSATDLAQIKSDIQEIVRDTSVNTRIKYRQYTGQDYYDPADQIIASPYTDWSGVSAIRGLVTEEEQKRIGNVSIGMTKFVMMQSAVSNTMSTSDVIVDSGASYNVRKVSYDPLGIVYILYGEEA